MHSNKRPRRKLIWIIPAATVAASLILSGCGASKSQPPDQISVPGGNAAGAPGSGTAPAQPDPPGIAQDLPLPVPIDGENGEDAAPGTESQTEWQNGGPGAAQAAPSADDFLLVPDRGSLPSSVQNWHDVNRQYQGAFLTAADGQSYLLVSAGAMPTGGYSLSLKDIKETNQGWRVEVTLHKPGPNAMVTQVVTYPSILFEVPAGDVEVILHDGSQSTSLPLNEGGETH